MFYPHRGGRGAAGHRDEGRARRWANDLECQTQIGRFCVEAPQLILRIRWENP